MFPVALHTFVNIYVCIRGRISAEGDREQNAKERCSGLKKEKVK
jgi:hypothetical protein